MHSSADAGLRILVISLGNRPPLQDTRHSAGHIVLDALVRSKLLLGDAHPPFDKQFPRSAWCSRGPTYTLVQCPTAMNVSGKFVASAYKAALADVASPDRLGLVLVHDEMENELGKVRRRGWDNSHKGHNGVRSVQQHLRDPPSAAARALHHGPPPVLRAADMCTRICVGIGRPESREPRDVSAYVLGEFSREERMVIETDSALGVMKHLSEFEARMWMFLGERSRDG